MIHRKILTLLVAAATIGIALPATGYTDEEAGFARVSYLEGEVTFQRANAVEPLVLTSNMPISSGDRVWTGELGRGEFQLFDGSFVRTDWLTKIDFQALDGQDASFDASTILKLWSGSLYLDVTGFRDGEEKNFQVDTPSASIYILSNGLFRIDLYEDGATRVTVHNGGVETVGMGGSHLLTSGERTYVAMGDAPEPPSVFNSFEMDDFDQWNEERREAHARKVRTVVDVAATYNVDTHVAGIIYSYWDDFYFYGRWVHHPGYGWIWCPTSGLIGSSWSPYRDGYWYWTQAGWFWVSYDPWGWAPYRYGRWFWYPNYGWAWVPGSRWSPAWVYWYRDHSTVGWAAMDVLGRPAVRDARVWKQYPYRAGQIDSRQIDTDAWRFVSADKFGSSPVPGVSAKPLTKRAYSLDPKGFSTQAPKLPRAPGFAAAGGHGSVRSGSDSVRQHGVFDRSRKGGSAVSSSSSSGGREPGARGDGRSRSGPQDNNRTVLEELYRRVSDRSGRSSSSGSSSSTNSESTRSGESVRGSESNRNSTQPRGSSSSGRSSSVGSRDSTRSSSSSGRVGGSSSRGSTTGARSSSSSSNSKANSSRSSSSSSSNPKSSGSSSSKSSSSSSRSKSSGSSSSKSSSSSSRSKSSGSSSSKSSSSSSRAKSSGSSSSKGKVGGSKK